MAYVKRHNGVMDRARLKLETASYHVRAERSFPLMGADLDVETYAEVLKRLYGFIKGWEIWAGSANRIWIDELLMTRRKSLLLMADLQHFGISVPTAVYPGPKLARAERPEFLGAMYVVEGSTLGGQYIARQVERVLSLRSGEGDAYFRGYEGRTALMWRDFTNILDDVPDCDAESLIRAAQQMFMDFTEWMERPSAG
jgi:heme oxygenase